MLHIRVGGRFGFVIARFIQAVPLVLAVLLVVFLMLKITPGDPARIVAGARASASAVAKVRRQLGLDRPLYVQFALYVWHVLHGNLGTSIRTGTPVSQVITQDAPVTLSLIVGAIVLTTLISIPAAAASARRPDGLIDHSVRAVGLVGLAMPVYWLGLMLILLIAIPTHLFPVAGWGSGFGEHITGLVLPWIALAVGIAPVVVRSLRSSMIDVLASDQVMAARSIGVGGIRLVRRFLLRNAALPSIVVLATQTTWLLFGVVLVENTFNLPGLGQDLVSAVQFRDFPLLQGLTLVFSLAVTIIYLVTDILFAALDPRVQIG